MVPVGKRINAVYSDLYIDDKSVIFFESSSHIFCTVGFVIDHSRKEACENIKRR